MASELYSIATKIDASSKDDFKKLDSITLEDYTRNNEVGYEILTGSVIPYAEYDNQYETKEEQEENEIKDFKKADKAVRKLFSNGSAKIITLSANGEDAVKGVWKNSYHFRVRNAGYYLCGTDLPMPVGCDRSVYLDKGRSQKLRMAYMSKKGNNRPLVRCELDGNKIKTYKYNDLPYGETLSEYIIQNVKNESLIISEREYAEAEKSVELQVRQEKVKVKSTETFYDITEEKVETLVDLLSDERMDDRVKWLTFMRCMYNVSVNYEVDGLKLAHIGSKRSNKYSESEVEGFFNRASHAKTKKDCQITIGSLFYWAKKDSPEEFRKLIKQDRKQCDDMITRARQSPKEYIYSDYVKFVDVDVKEYDVIKYLVDTTMHVISHGSHKMFTRCLDKGSYVYTELKESLAFHHNSAQNIELNVSGTTKTISEYEWRLYNRNTYDTVRFVPFLDNDPTDEREFNIFEGFRYKFDKVDANAPPKSIQKILWHIENIICGGSDTLTEAKTYEYLLNWISHLFQKPNDKVGIAVVLQSNTQGAGKDAFADFLMQCIGVGHCIKVSKMDEITSQFNSHMQGKLLIIGDEVANYAGYKLADQLKAVITENHRAINGKGRDMYMIESCERYIFTSNNEFCVRVDESDRRYLVLKVSDKMVGNHDYFEELFRDLKNEDVQRDFFNYMGSRNISGWRSRDIPMTGAKRNLLTENIPGPIKFLIEYIDERPRDAEYITKDVYRQYDDYCSESNIKADNKMKFNKALESVGIERKKLRKNGGRGMYYIIKIEQLKESIREILHDPTFEFDNYEEEEDEKPKVSEEEMRHAMKRLDLI